MRSLIGFSIVLLASSIVFAQNRSGFVPTPGVTRGFGSVVFPGGTSAMPGIQRTTGSVVFPGGGGPQIGVPGVPMQGLGFTQFSNNVGTNGIGPGATTWGNPNWSNIGNGNGNGNGGNWNNNNNGNWKGGRRRNNNTVVYAYPVFVGGGYYGGYSGDYSDPSGYGAIPPDAQAQFQGQPQQQQPNIVVIYPQGQAPQGAPVPQSQGLYQPPATQPSGEPLSITADDQATHYLIAFKDHTVYSAVAYWVDGDTLHYFTTGNTHNQVSLSLVDRALTEKLNKDSGLEVKLPPSK